MTVYVDAGNSSVKMMVRKADDFVVTNKVAGEVVWVASVRSEQWNIEFSNRLYELGAQQVVFIKVLNGLSGLELVYEDVDKLGVDRFLVLLAVHCRQQMQCIVVDAGTATTIDLYSESRHLGGYIIPGVEKTRKALLENTQRVFSDAKDNYDIAPGENTASCVEHGLLLMQVASVIRAKELYLPKAEILVCGGAGQVLVENIPSSVYCASLVFEGMERVRQFYEMAILDIVADQSGVLWCQ